MQLFSNHWASGNKGPGPCLERLSRLQIGGGKPKRSPVVSVN